jgi:hypothetical protein
MNPEIEQLYTEDEYSGREEYPYRAYLRCLQQVFALEAIDSFCDAGCSSGSLLYLLRKSYPGMQIQGLDYFDWARLHANPSIAAHIGIVDLSLPYFNGIQYDIVNLTEVGEHLAPESEDIFIDNLVRMSRDILILGWSEDKSDGAHQHLSPRPRRCIRSQLVRRGFDVWPEATNLLRESLRNSVRYGAYHWWYKPLTVYRRRRYATIHPKRFIQGCSTDNISHGIHHKFAGHSLQSQFLGLRDDILLAVMKSQPLSILRFGDGDLFFVNAIPLGSACPGKRALRIQYPQKRNLLECRLGLFQVDFIAAEIGSMMEGGLRLMLVIQFLSKFLRLVGLSRFPVSFDFRSSSRLVSSVVVIPAKLFKSYLVRLMFYPVLALARHRLRLSSPQFPIIRPFPYSFETVYALVASRLLFKMFPSEILLVGQAEKLAAVEKLVENESYRKYLGIEKFCGYVGVEKVGAADDESLILDAIQLACESSNPKIILLGIGSAKLYVLPRIRHFSNAVVIDVGAGIDALAGVISHDRPYFADWVNFRSRDIDYNSMDLMDLENPNRGASKYRTILF